MKFFMKWMLPIFMVIYIITFILVNFGCARQVCVEKTVVHEKMTNLYWQTTETQHEYCTKWKTVYGK